MTVTSSPVLGYLFSDSPFIEFLYLPSDTIGVPPLARAIVSSGTARKTAGIHNHLALKP